MKITGIRTFILHVPVTRKGIEDSTHRVTHWGAPGVIIETDAGLQGYGYTGTHAHLPTDRLITECIEHTYGPLLIGEDPAPVQHLWERLFRLPPAQWVGRCGITHLALSAVDVALWDIKAKSVGVPLWSLLGGNGAKRLEGYNTDGGWLNWSDDDLIADSRRLVDEGYGGVKIKVGSPDTRRDLVRVEKVRAAIGSSAKLMVDANGRWDLPTAMQVGGRLSDWDVLWLEEPIWYDDLAGHAHLARTLRTPIALGEQLYNAEHFAAFIQAGAVHYVQADAVRLAGVTEWWRVAELAHAYHLPVVPHIGDMMQVHLHLALAHPACTMLEYIPWLRECFVEPATVREGFFVPPRETGAGTTLRPDAIERFGVL
jgi:L-alanine-DL-glutamate epimerase-like enolase superfamily enzyme